MNNKLRGEEVNLIDKLRKIIETETEEENRNRESKRTHEDMSLTNKTGFVNERAKRNIDGEHEKEERSE